MVISDTSPPLDAQTTRRLYDRAGFLAIYTIFYNIVEGVVSVWFGATDETLSLFGFGVDSFVEVISGIGIWHMIRRIRSNSGEASDSFERQALRITAWAFFILAGGLAISALISLRQQHSPESTSWGVIISLASISFMWLLIRWKTSVGTALGSAAILADAACSRMCLYLSLALLIASGGFAITGIGGFDAVGAMLIAILSFKEGKESLEKAKGISCGCGCKCGGS